MTALFRRIQAAPRELKLFVLASIMMGFGSSVMDSTFNNFLNSRFHLTGFQRSFLELPRELPGFLVVFVTALLWFLCSRRLGGVAMFLAALGAVLVGFLSSSYGLMTLWLFIYSMGQHLFLPLSSGIGMELAREGKTGQRLGQLNALRNAATIGGSFVVFLGFRYLGFSFNHTFVIVAVGLAMGALLMLMMKRRPVTSSRQFLTLHKEYRLYYVLAVLYGARKQIFITFAPWVLVTVFNQPTQTLATLLTIGGIIGILFQPFLGRAIDKLGERTVLISEAVLLVFAWFGSGFGRVLLGGQAAFYLICGCYLLDQMLMSVSMARATYIKKIALKPEDVQPALTASITIDHLFSIAIALLGGVIWNQFGYQYVFLLGVGIAILNIFTAARIRIPQNDRVEAPAVGQA